MLRACNRVLKPGGVISFGVIAVADGLSDKQVARAVGAGPAQVEAGPGYPALMAAAGFEDVEVIDVSEEYLSTCAAWVSERDAESAELERVIGRDELAERQAGLRLAIETTKEGLLKRYLISAGSPT